MEKIYIKDLEIYAYHGVFPEEKEKGQLFVLDITLELDAYNACMNDCLEDTVSYADVCETVEKTMRSKKCDLIEHAAQLVCDSILRNYPPVKAVTVLLKKPEAPVKQKIGYAAVELRRER